jgi:Subtilase family
MAASPEHRVHKVDATAAAPTVTPDPAFFLPGLMWNEERVNMAEAFRVSTGRPAVTVGVADTGLDFTHSELAPRITQVVDFTANENPSLCKTFFTPAKSDADWAAQFGGPATTDWNGHGSWIGGNIAAVLDGAGVNGIAPDVGLVALKISQWCGSAYDSTILDAFLFAANHGIDIVSISFGGYLDRSDPDQNLIYQQYVAAVRYAKRFGTTIVAAAGNEHVRVGAGGRVLTHGPLTAPGTAAADFGDLFGLYEVPGGVRVSSTSHQRGTSSTHRPRRAHPLPRCPPTFETCKPSTDAHQQPGAGLRDQLAYYSNYGPRIDVAAPGGARKFNLPLWDRGGTPGFPYTAADGTASLRDVQHNVQLGAGDPLLRVHRRRVPGRSVLLHDPGDVDGHAARVGSARADRQCQAEPPAPRRCPRQPAGEHRAQRSRQHHAAVVRHRHVQWRPIRSALHDGLLPPRRRGDLRQGRLRRGHRRCRGRRRTALTRTEPCGCGPHVVDARHRGSVQESADSWHAARDHAPGTRETDR